MTACRTALLLLLALPAGARAEGAPDPLLAWGEGEGLRLEVRGNLRGSYLNVQPFLTDRDATLTTSTPLETRVRLSPEVRVARFGLVGEVDLATGAITGLPAFATGASAHPAMQTVGLRQLYLEYQGTGFLVRAGQLTSQWGLGLVANNGAHDAPAGEFGGAHHGDLVYRAVIAGRPLHGLGGHFRYVEPALAADLVARDDTADYASGDRALQGVLAVRYVRDPERNFGVYTVLRRQRFAGGDPLFRNTDAYVLDLAGRWRWEDATSGLYARVGAEAALITGTSTMARSDTAEILELRQFGGAAKAAVGKGRWEGMVDVGYASGDQNPYDDRLESFRFDADYHAGVVLYDEVLGWQTARAAARAADPELVGVAPEGVDLLPSRGAVFGSWYVFPRVRYGATKWLDVYGGPLFAFANGAMTDAFNTRLAGGSPRNALDGRPGRILGTELDLGVQARLAPTRGLALSATLEGGYLLPGDAFVQADGRVMPPVAAGRLRLSADF